MSLHIPNDKVDALFEVLKNNRSRVGIWLVPAEHHGQEAAVAIYTASIAVDLTKLYLAGLADDARFSALAPDRLSDLVAAIFAGGGNTRAIGYNLDLLLARLTSDQRAEFWNMALSGHPNPPRMLILMLPQLADHLLPQGFWMEQWEKAGKLLR